MPDDHICTNWRKATDQRLALFEDRLASIFDSLNEQDLLLNELLRKDSTVENLRERVQELESVHGGDGGRSSDTTFEDLRQRIQQLEDTHMEGGNDTGKSGTSGPDRPDPEELQLRLGGLEAFRSESDKAVGRLEAQLQVLQECLHRSAVLSDTALLVAGHRRHFEVTCASTGWHADAVFGDIMQKDEALGRIFGFIGHQEASTLQIAVGSRAAGPSTKKAKADGQLQRAIANAETEPNNPCRWDELSAAIEVATFAELDSQQLQMAEDLMVKGRALSAVARSSSQKELDAARRALELVGFDKTEIKSIVEEAELRISECERVALAQQQLRIAVSWGYPTKLRKAITDAEAAGVSVQDIEKARMELKSLDVRAAHEHLHDLLRGAKPGWTPKDLDSALSKLASIGIVTVARISMALESEEPAGHLNEQLRQAGQKAFTEDTVKALRQALTFQSRSSS